ncbi:hemerythrin domain-containing protein [Desertimonas flava]|jgi:hypothetical protein|uniref:hemerythrin domain-containing protein n=1 Tax=Desertimonas flava TaxID=2064846 RepID=UPI0013C480BC|nr:hemerythrin domain-containing protein [Desertimonas flava]
MSDYSDHGSHVELDALEDEHEQLRAALRALLESADPAVDDLLDALGRLLDRHTRREESGVFAELRSIEVPAQYVALLEHHHHDIEDALEAARRDHAQVTELARRIEAHLTIEENDMFHVAHQLLSPANWDAIDRNVAAAIG